MGASNTARSEAVVSLVTRLAEPILDDFALELVEVQFRREPPGWILRLIIDRPGGVSLEDCSRVNRELGLLLEVEDPVDHPYHLEVSSPGLDRPLRTGRDFRRCLHRKVVVTVREAEGGAAQHVGTITGVEDDAVRLATEDGEIRVPFDLLLKAKQVIEF